MNTVKIEISGKVATTIESLNSKTRDFLLSHYLNKKENDFKKFIETEHGIVITNTPSTNEKSVQ